jgi:hypothetical protein
MRPALLLLLLVLPLPLLLLLLLLLLPNSHRNSEPWHPL